jgi:hypothetical protein
VQVQYLYGRRRGEHLAAKQRQEHAAAQVEERVAESVAYYNADMAEKVLEEHLHNFLSGDPQARVNVFVEEMLQASILLPSNWAEMVTELLLGLTGVQREHKSPAVVVGAEQLLLLQHLVLA